MHQRRNISIRTTRRALVACAVVVVLLMLVQLAARSELLLRKPLQAQLPGIGYTLNGRIEVEGIRPAGGWGVALTGVRFYPLRNQPNAYPDRPLVRLERVVVHPDMGALLRGTPSARAIEVHTPQLSIVVHGGDGPHVDWFRWLIEEVRHGGVSEPQDGPPTEESVAIQALVDALPALQVHDGQFTFDDVSGALPSLGLRVDDIAYHPPNHTGARGHVRGDVLIEGLGRGRVSGTLQDDQRLSLQFVDTNDLIPLLPFRIPASHDAHLSVGGIHVNWPPSLSVSDVRATALDADIPGLPAPIDVITARDIVTTFDRSGLQTVAREVVARDGEGVAPVAIPSVRLARAWRSPSVDGEIVFADAQGDTASVTLTLPDHAPATAHIRAEDFDIAPVLSFISRGASPLDDGTFSGQVDTRWDAENRTLLNEIEGTLQGLELRIPALGPNPLDGITIEAEAHVGLWPQTGDILVRRGRLYYEALDLVANVESSRHGDRVTFDATAVLPRRPAQGLFETLPATWTSALQGFAFTGEVGGRMAVSVDTDHLDELSVDFSLDTNAFDVITYGPNAPIDRFSDPDFTWIVSTRNGPRRIGPGARDWTALSELPPLAYRSIVAAEDDAFWMHNGFDPRGIQAALRANIEAGQVVRGGSTISQQVAKNLFLTHERTFSRKLQEAVLTWLMERELGKQAILELYVNLAEWGDDVYGIREGAMAYFNHSPRQLTLRESAFLAAILPNPRVFGAQYLNDALEESRRVKMGNILNNLRRAGFMSDETYGYHRQLVLNGNVSHRQPPGEFERNREEVGTDQRVGHLLP